MPPLTPPEALAALLGSILAINIHLLILIFTSLPPKPFDGPFLGPIYVFALQVLAALFLIRVLCIVLGREFRLGCAKIKALFFLYAVFPIPIMVGWVHQGLLQRICSCRC
ncbi:hypothetical protein BJX61DRAFT_530264 [Aspergillus egyptiacus]|nr:hypothetical protein BJX61DRAFT_530264 [Aspergillus egyptiacus]